MQTNFVQASETEFAAEIIQANKINHIVVFLTGVQPLSDGIGGSGTHTFETLLAYICKSLFDLLVYIRLPSENEAPIWYYLGFIANTKPSAIFKIAQLAHNKSNEQQLFAASSSSASGALIGIMLEPLSIIENKVAAESTAASNQASAVFSILKNVRASILVDYDTIFRNDDYKSYKPFDLVYNNAAESSKSRSNCRRDSCKSYTRLVCNFSAPITGESKFLALFAIAVELFCLFALDKCY